MKKLLALLLLPYGLWLSFAYQYHFVDGANLLFHEAGHLILRPFGDWLQFLGGTLGQLAFPIAADFAALVAMQLPPRWRGSQSAAAPVQGEAALWHGSATP